MQKIAAVTLLLSTTILLGPHPVLADEAGANRRKEAKVIEVGMTFPPDKADPVELWNFQQYLVAHCIYQTLVRINEAGKIVADLSSRWTIDKDGTHYRFELNPAARFHDGRRVTSRDVAISLARHLWPKSPSAVKAYLSGLLKGAVHVPEGQVSEGIATPSENVIEFTLKHPYPPFLFVLAMPGFSVLPAERRTTDVHQWVGSGPMRARYESVAQKWHMTPSPDYVGTRPRINEMTISRLAGLDAVKSAVKNREVDVAVGLPIIDLDDLKRDPGYSISGTNTLMFSHLFFNLRQKAFREAKLRRDLGSLVQTIASKPANLNEFLSFEPFYIPKGVMPPHYYDRKPIRLIAAEFARKWGKKLKGLKLKIVVLKSFFTPQMLDEVESSLKGAGLEVTLARIPGGEYTGALKSGDYDLISGGYTGNFPDPDGFIDPLSETSNLRYGRFPSHDLFREIEKLRFIPDAKRRLKEYSSALLEFESKWYFIPLYRINAPIIHNERLSMPDSNFRYESELWNIFWRE